jgi:dTDP-4-amino-4,6-dideoxygalactose transaminase
LRAEGIGAAIHYEAIHRQPYYRELLSLSDGDLPIADRVGKTILSLPLTPAMTVDDVRDVLNATEKVFDYYRT